jgi:hypothetical protein
MFSTLPFDLVSSIEKCEFIFSCVDVLLVGLAIEIQTVCAKSGCVVFGVEDPFQLEVGLFGVG